MSRSAQLFEQRGERGCAMLVVCTEEVVRNTTAGLVSILVIGNYVMDGAMIGEDGKWRRVGDEERSSEFRADKYGLFVLRTTSFVKSAADAATACQNTKQISRGKVR
jgi:hypothetical protein